MQNGPMDQTKRTSHRTGCRVTVLGGIVLTTVGIGVLTYVVMGVLQAREAAMHTNCRGHMSQLSMALWNYHDTYDSFPPAYVADVDGTPLHSWRVLILPFIDGNDIYQQYRFDEPWNGPHNSQLADRLASRFQCPGRRHDKSSHVTDYVALVGPESAFPGSSSTRMTDLRDGPENTILLAEIAHSDIHWMEPRDLSTQTMSFQVNDPGRPSLSSYHPGGPAVIFADGITAYRLQSTIRPETLKALTTIQRGEPVSRDKLIRQLYSLAE